MIIASEELAEAIGFSYKSIKHGVDSGRFSPRMAIALENHLNLERGILKRTSDVTAPRMSREWRGVFQSIIGEYVGRLGIEKVSRLMECRYEVARHIVSGTYLPSLLSIRALIRNTEDQRFAMFDDPSYVYEEHDNVLGKMIRDRRIALGITQKQLAELLDSTNHAICRYEKGQRNITPERLVRLAGILKDPEIIRIANELQDRSPSLHPGTQSQADAA